MQTLLLILITLVVLVVGNSLLLLRKSWRGRSQVDNDDGLLWFDRNSHASRALESPQEHGGHEHEASHGHALDGHDTLDVGDHDLDHLDVDHF